MLGKSRLTGIVSSVALCEFMNATAALHNCFFEFRVIPIFSRVFDDKCIGLLCSTFNFQNGVYIYIYTFWVSFVGFIHVCRFLRSLFNWIFEQPVSAI